MSDRHGSDAFRLDRRPRQNPAFEIRGTFDDNVQQIWELCDGLTAVAEILELSALKERYTREILLALRRSGALLLEGERPDDVADRIDDWDHHWSETASGRFGIEPPTAAGSRSQPTAPSRAPKSALAEGTLENTRPITREQAASYQTQQEHAAELFQRACHLESLNKHAEALRLFRAAVKTDRQIDYVRRAAGCALQVKDLTVAEKLAAAAVEMESDSPAAVALLARVYRAQNRLERAQVVLKRAIDLAGSDVSLSRDLQRELREVRRRLER